MTNLKPGTIEHISNESDYWRAAILAEREREPPHNLMKRALLLMNGSKHDGLVLGDASLIQVRYLIEREGFERVVDVDASPTLLDDFYISDRLVKELSTFEDYAPPEESFDFIYGKSISFYSKNSIVDYLKKLEAALKDNGVFAAEWARLEDTFSREHYTLEAIDTMYEASGFEIIEMIAGAPREVEGLVVPGVGHTVKVIARSGEST